MSGPLSTLRYPPVDPGLKVVAVDFDGVLCKSQWPSPAMGPADPEAKKLVLHYVDQDCEVIVFTARPESHHERIWKWLEKEGIGWAIYDVTNRKPVCSVYVDDRAYCWPLYRDTELAWAAGFYDGEGCTSLLKKGKNIAVRACCTQKDRRALERFYAAVGGLGKIGPPSKQSGVSNWFSNSEPVAREVLTKLWPFLGVVKREQAERCYEQSTWHDGQKNKLICNDPTHEVIQRSEGRGRRCRTCQKEYMQGWLLRNRPRTTQ